MKAEEQDISAYCASCSYPLAGKFCSQCGEKTIKPEDRTLKHFFAEFFHGITHADSKFLKSLKYLLTKPGFLTKEYISGRRKAYTNPLSLFLIANLLYLLILPADALNSRYVSQVRGQGTFYTSLIKGKAEQKMQSKGWTVEQMEEHYDAKSTKISKLVLILLVMIFSIPIAILFYSRRFYYADHLTFALEFVNYIILGVLLIFYFMLYAILLFCNGVLHLGIRFNPNGDVGMTLLFVLLWAFLLPAARRVYEQNWAYTIFKTLLLLISTIFVVLLYRFILFHITLALL